MKKKEVERERGEWRGIKNGRHEDTYDRLTDRQAETLRGRQM